MPASAITTSFSACGCCASSTHKSGPMPAGSPAVRAMLGVALIWWLLMAFPCLKCSESVLSKHAAALFFFQTQFDKRLVAQLAQPFLVGLVGFLCTQRHAHLQ